MDIADSTQPLCSLAAKFWRLLQLSPHANRGFSHLYTNEDVVADILSAADLNFTEGLLDMLNGSEPPGVEYFMTTPTPERTEWIVYSVILQKPAEVSQIYIGSGTGQGGCISRMNTYKRQIEDQAVDIVTDAHLRPQIPRYMGRSLKEGWRIAHVGALVRTPLPALVDRAWMRLTIRGIEATLTAALNAFYGKHYMNECIELGLWARQECPYNGLCSSNAMSEAFGKYEYNPQTLINYEELAKAQKERIKVYAKQGEQRRVEQKIYWCEKHRSAFASPKALSRHMSSSLHDPDKEYAKRLRHEQKLAMDARVRQNAIDRAAREKSTQEERQAANQARLEARRQEKTLKENASMKTCNAAEARRIRRIQMAREKRKAVSATDKHTCKSCGKTMGSSDLLKRHITTCSRKRDNVEVKARLKRRKQREYRAAVKASGKWTCKSCGKTSGGKAALKKHGAVCKGVA
ncbi:MAG: hypothetical protein LQ341_005480 [Variospora aurantia]|nr:MAG: hypothetical protein LQ341_005480 [Variospora aurantia]